MVDDYYLGCDDNQSLYSNLYDVGQNYNITSPSYSGLTSSNIEVSYQLRIFDYDLEEPIDYAFGLISLSYSLDNGSTWAILGTVNNSNFTPQENCQTIEYTLPTANITNTSQLKFKWDLAYEGDGDYEVLIDTFVVEYAETASTKELDKSNLKVYPNPVSDQLNIDYDLNITNLTIFDLLGRKMNEISKSDNINSIDVSNLSSGTYLLQIQAEDQSQSTIKFIKK